MGIQPSRITPATPTNSGGLRFTLSMASHLRHRRAGGSGHDEGLLSEPLLQDDEDVSAAKDEPLVQKGGGDQPHSGPPILSQILQAFISGWGYVIATITHCMHTTESSAGEGKELKLTLVQMEKLERLRSKTAVRFDISLTEHQDGLKRLWKLACPGVELEAMKSEQWKEMGWQGTDPSTDFRGAGYFALENLIYMAENYPRLFKDLMNKADGDRSDWEYPFCVAGVNITYNLIGILDIRQDRLPTTAAAQNFLSSLAGDDVETAFAEIYCMAFKDLDIKWLEMRASYMDFPVVMKAVRQNLETCLTNAYSLESARLMLIGNE